MQPSSPPASSFAWPLLWMPRKRRHAMRALYNWCRQLDDAVDMADSPAQAQAVVAAWRALMESGEVLGNPHIRHQDAQIFFSLMQEYALPKADIMAFLEALQMDADGAMCAPSYAQLRRYIQGVAGCIGRLSVHVFGCVNERTLACADRLGHAMQITNMLRDLREDAVRGRLYLPREWLELHHLPCVPEVVYDTSNAFLLVTQHMAQEATDAYAEARRELNASDVKQMIPALLMADIYTHYLMCIRQGEPLRAPSRLWLLCRLMAYSVGWRLSSTR